MILFFWYILLLPLFGGCIYIKGSFIDSLILREISNSFWKWSFFFFFFFFWLPPVNIYFLNGGWRCLMHGVWAHLNLRFDGPKKMAPWVIGALKCIFLNLFWLSQSFLFVLYPMWDWIMDCFVLWDVNIALIVKGTCWYTQGIGMGPAITPQAFLVVEVGTMWFMLSCHVKTKT